MTSYIANGEWGDEQPQKMNIDELFELEYQKQDARAHTYNKVLARVHRAIKQRNRMRPQDKFCYFSFPDVLVGCPLYNKEECVEYVLDKLAADNFKAVYVHPSMLVISWQHWIHERQRAEVLKHTGLRVDGMGNVKSKRGGGNGVLGAFGGGSSGDGVGAPRLRLDTGGTVGAGMRLGSALMALGASDTNDSNNLGEYKPLGIYDGLGLGSDGSKLK